MDIKPGDVIDVQALRNSLNYLLPDNPRVCKAFEVASQLEEWIQENAQSYLPCTNVLCTYGMLQISVGDDIVYNTEEDTDDDDLSFLKCRRRYLNHLLEKLEPFASSEDSVVELLLVYRDQYPKGERDEATS